MRECNGIDHRGIYVEDSSDCTPIIRHGIWVLYSKDSAWLASHIRTQFMCKNNIMVF